MHLNIFTIALAYSSMVPIILPCALTYFALWYLIDKYNLMFAYYDKCDRGGSFTPMVFRRIFLSLAIYHFSMFGIFLVKESYVCAGMLLPLFVVDGFALYFASTIYLKRSLFIPLIDACNSNRFTATLLGLGFKYANPALGPDPQLKPGEEEMPKAPTMLMGL